MEEAGGSHRWLSPALAPDSALFGLGPEPHRTLATLGPVQDAENFLVGASSGDLQGPLRPLAQQQSLSAPREPVEVGQPGPCSLTLSGGRQTTLALAAVCLFKKQAALP